MFHLGDFFFTMIWGLEWFGTCLYILWRTLWVTDSSNSKTRFTLVSDSYKLESVKEIEYPITSNVTVSPIMLYKHKRQLCPLAVPPDRLLNISIWK